MNGGEDAPSDLSAVPRWTQAAGAPVADRVAKAVEAARRIGNLPIPFHDDAEMSSYRGMGPRRGAHGDAAHDCRGRPECRGLLRTGQQLEGCRWW